MLSLSLSLTSATMRLPAGGALPSISIASGSGYAGSVYHADRNGGQWHADGAPISGATAQDWTMTLALEGAAIDYRIGALVSNAIEMWVPADAAGLVALMDIRQGITQAGGLVSAWVSQVGGISATQATGSLQPGYGSTAFDGAPGTAWDGAKLLTNFGITDAPAARSYIGGLMFAAGTTGTLTFLDGNSASGFGMRINGDNTLSSVSSGVGARATSTITVSRGNPIILSGRIGASYVFRDGGASIGSGTPSGGFAGSGNSRIGSDRLGSSRMSGVISSHLIYDAWPGTDETAKAEGWVAWTLGKADLLTAGHPYKSAGPRAG